MATRIARNGPKSEIHIHNLTPKQIIELSKIPFYCFEWSMELERPVKKEFVVRMSMRRNAEDYAESIEEMREASKLEYRKPFKLLGISKTLDGDTSKSGEMTTNKTIARIKKVGRSSASPLTMTRGWVKKSLIEEQAMSTEWIDICTQSPVAATDSANTSVKNRTPKKGKRKRPALRESQPLNQMDRKTDDQKLPSKNTQPKPQKTERRTKSSAKRKKRSDTQEAYINERKRKALDSRFIGGFPYD